MASQFTSDIDMCLLIGLLDMGMFKIMRFSYGEEDVPKSFS